MKITLDIDQLLKEGRISQEEYDRLKQFASESTASLALNIVLAFGIIAVAGGSIALLQSSAATIFLGVVLAGLGGFICAAGIRKWALLGNILLPLGALTGAGGIVAATNGSVTGFACIAGLFLAGAVAARSGLLASLAAFAMLSALGGATGYDHAEYYLCIDRPMLTVVVFTMLTGLGYVINRFVPADYSRLAIIFSRTAFVVANFGFWVGSLWGDRGAEYSQRAGLSISEWPFIIGWAVLLLIVGGWAAYRNQRWLVNTVAAFAAIHLYTQWFEHFSATPGTIIIAGVFTIVVAYALISYNRKGKSSSEPNIVSSS